MDRFHGLREVQVEGHTDEKSSAYAQENDFRLIRQAKSGFFSGIGPA
jgi:hypothetical protein